MNDSDHGSDAAPDADLLGVIDDYMEQCEPDRERTAGLREKILGMVRDDLHRGPTTELVTEKGNHFALAVSAMRSLIRTAVDSVSGIRSRSVTVSPTGDPIGSSMRVSLTVSMRAGTDAAARSSEVRATVAAALLEGVGLPVESIDITVEDVHDE